MVSEVRGLRSEGVRSGGVRSRGVESCDVTVANHRAAAGRRRRAMAGSLGQLAIPSPAVTHAS